MNVSTASGPEYAQRRERQRRAAQESTGAFLLVEIGMLREIDLTSKPTTPGDIGLWR